MTEKDLEIEELRREVARLKKVIADMDNRIISVSTCLFDEEEVHYNCTVQILRNSVTGEESIGWWEGGQDG